MTRASITIEDVARVAGVSRQTVSRVINARSNVAAASRERVETAIADLGYVPNTAARRMGGARSYLLLAVIERGAGAAGAGERSGRLPLDAMLLAGLDCCASAGYHILFEQLETDGDGSLAQLNRTLTALSPDGVILTPPLDQRADLRASIENRQIALEYLGERVEFGHAVPGIDDGALGEAAARHLIDLGHRQIGFVTGSCEPSRSQRRVAGYRRAMAAKGSRAHMHFTADGRLGFADALELAKNWLVPTIRPTAIIAETDEVALAILETAHELGLCVPRDLSLVSLEERASLARAKPPVSVLFQPYAKLFRHSCSKLIERAENAPTQDARPDAKPDAEEVPAPIELIERKSIAKAPRTV